MAIQVLMCVGCVYLHQSTSSLVNQTAFFLIYSDGKNRVWCNSVAFFVLLDPQILGIVYWCGLTSRRR